MLQCAGPMARVPATTGASGGLESNDVGESSSSEQDLDAFMHAALAYNIPHSATRPSAFSRALRRKILPQALALPNFTRWHVTTQDRLLHHLHGKRLRVPPLAMHSSPLAITDPLI